MVKVNQIIEKISETSSWNLGIACHSQLKETNYIAIFITYLLVGTNILTVEALINVYFCFFVLLPIGFWNGESWNANIFDQSISF